MAVVLLVQRLDVVKRVVEVEHIRVGRADSYATTGAHIAPQVIEEGAGIVLVLEDVLGGHEVIAAGEH
jgi:hypothetical protein